MRDIKDIEANLLKTREECARLQRELDDARLAKYLREAGVPEGCRPVFRHKKSGVRVLVTRMETYWAVGMVIKRDGTLSNSRQKYLYAGEYEFVGEAEAKCS